MNDAIEIKDRTLITIVLIIAVTTITLLFICSNCIQSEERELTKRQYIATNVLEKTHL